MNEDLENILNIIDDLLVWGDFKEEYDHRVAFLKEQKGEMLKKGLEVNIVNQLSKKAAQVQKSYSRRLWTAATERDHSDGTVEWKKSSSKRHLVILNI